MSVYASISRLPDRHLTDRAMLAKIRNAYSMFSNFFRTHISKLAKHLPSADQRNLYWELGRFLVEEKVYSFTFINWNRFRAPGKWRTLGFPFTPSPGEVRIYVETIRDLKPKTILLLGSTPELRDEIALYQKESPEPIRCIIADQSPMMLWAMIEYTHHVDPEKEIWVKGPWEELPLPAGSVDLVLGDLVLRQFLSGDRRSFFLQKISELLTPDGFFISRTQAPEVYTNIDPQERIAEFLYESQGRYDPHRVGSLIIDLLASSASSFSEVTNSLHVRKEIETALFAASNSNDRHLLMSVQHNAPNPLFDSPFHSRATISAWLQKFFSIKTEKTAKDYRGGENFPIITLSRKDA